jgi:hypothetical protein
MADIDGYNTTIEKSDVENRIEELEGQRGYDVVRLRNDEVIEQFDDEDEARQYIEDEDYNPERVIARQRDLDDDDAEELRNLRKLIDDVGVSGDWTLYNESYFDSGWAQERAREALGLSYRADPFGDWPLSLIDWDDAAGDQRDAEYPYEYTFDGTSFYSED